MTTAAEVASEASRALERYASHLREAPGFAEYIEARITALATAWIECELTNPELTDDARELYASRRVDDALGIKRKHVVAIANTLRERNASNAE